VKGHYCISHYLCPESMGLIDFLDAVTAAGFRGVGLTERALREIEPKRLRPELASRGLEVSSVNSAGYFLHTDREAGAAQAAKNRWFIDCAAQLGGAPLNLIVGGLAQTRGELTLAQARLRAREETNALCTQANDAGVPVLFEPIHPMGMWTKGCVHSLRESLDMIEGLPNATLNLDLFHSWWDSDLAALVERGDSPIGLVQICDVDTAGPDHVPHRAPLGEGVVDVRGILEACARRPHRPRIEVELFAFQLTHRPFTDIVAATTAWLAHAERTAPGLAAP